MLKLKNSYYWPLVIEFIIVYCLLSTGLIIESFQRNILILNSGLINIDIILFILKETFLVTVIFVITYNFIKKSYYSLIRNIFIKINDHEKDERISILTDAYLICASLLATIKIRPIIHTTYLESNIQNFTYDFARYDSFFSILVLLVLAIPLIYLIYKKNTKKKKIKILGIIFVVFLVGVINSFSNFEARELESSAVWTQKNWQGLSEKASDALDQSKTDEEKAVAYFWLGVAENRKNNFDKAVEYQLKAISLYPRFAAAYSSLSNAYSALGENSKALENAKKCIKYDSKYAWCYNSLMNYYLSIGEMEKALVNSKIATDLDPGNIELQENYFNLLNKRDEAN